jgi:transcriptional regulator with XRE-family HTH domain
MKTIHGKANQEKKKPKAPLVGFADARKESGKTIPELALLTGFSQSYLYKVEYKDAGGSPDLVSKLAKALGCSSDRLLGIGEFAEAQAAASEVSA